MVRQIIRKTSMRFGYDFKLPADTTFDSCAWYYGTTANDLRLSLTPGANTKKIENPTATKQGISVPTLYLRILQKLILIEIFCQSSGEIYKRWQDV